MATKKKTEGETQSGVEIVLGYKVIGEHFSGKNEADNAVGEAHQKGFRSAGLCVRGSNFVILFGNYDTAQSARANLEAIKGAGFKAEIENVTE